MTDGRQIRAADLEQGEHVETAPLSLARARKASERQAIEKALLRHRGRLGHAAQELGISRVTLYRLLGSHALRAAATPQELVLEHASSNERSISSGIFRPFAPGGDPTVGGENAL
jgi:hypothetical protein